MSSTEIILTGMVLLAALACLPALYWSTLRIERLRVQHQELASGLAAALRELELLAAMAAKAGEHLTRVERNVGSVDERVGVLELRGESRPYHQAIDLARGGADSAKLTRQLGLSQPEANLLTLLHGAKRRA